MKNIIKIRTNLVIKIWSLCFALWGSTFPQTVDQTNIMTVQKAVGSIAYCYQNLNTAPYYQIYSINADGTNNGKMFTSSYGLNHHDWSPDGKKLALVRYFSEATWSIYTVNIDGSNMSRITSVNNVWDTEPAWSPDMKKIAFTRTLPNMGYRNEIYVVNADGSNLQYIGIGYGPKWSPDTTKFVYSSDKSGSTQIYTCNTDGTGETILHRAGNNDCPIWSPDGSKIAFVSDSDGDYELCIMNADGSSVHQITNNLALEYSPRWSPDGSLLTFTSDLSAPSHWEVYIIKTDGSDFTRVTNTPGSATAINPCWRPVAPNNVGSKQEAKEMGFNLEQNYPNPFNPATTISYQLSAVSSRQTDLAKVSLKIFDCFGREIAILADGEKAPGKYKVTWNAAGYSSGVYLYQLKSNGRTITKKLTLLK